MAQSPGPIRFGLFEVDPQTGELRKNGVKLKLGGQPFQVLTILLARPGEVITREELQKELWPDTFVDVERNLNTAVNKIREVLGDSTENPRFVETLPRRGYRFIAPLQGYDLDVRAQLPPTILFEGSTQPKLRERSKILSYLALSTASIVLAAGVFFSIKSLQSPVLEPRALTRVTFDEGLQIEATWSPDGRFIAYSSDRGGKHSFTIGRQTASGYPV